MTRTAKRRIVIWGTVGSGLLALLVVALVPRPVPVDTGVVKRGRLEVTLDHEGMTRVRERYVVSAPVSGRLLRIELEPGDPVVADQTVVATFRPATSAFLDERGRLEAQARLRAARAGLAVASAGEQRARTAADLAETELGRTRQLGRQGAITQAALDRAEAEARARREDLDAATASVSAASHELEAARAVLVSPAKRDAQASGTLAWRAPVTGVVLRRMQQSEAEVAAGEPLLELADPTQLEVAADYLSADAVRLRRGLPVAIDRWGGGHELRGRVRRVDPAGFTKVSALGVEEQRVWVVIDFDAPYQAWKSLGDAYRVVTRVIVWAHDDVLQVPAGALFRHRERWAVFVVHAGRASLRQVDLGERNEVAAEVKQGLSAGQTVVLYPPSGVTDGVRVSARGANPE